MEEKQGPQEPQAQPWPDTSQSIEYEFYNYDQTTAYQYGNYQELGNDAFTSGSSGPVWAQIAENYLCSFNTDAPSELFDNSFQGNTTLQDAYALAFKSWIAYLHAVNQGTPTCTACSVPGAYNVTIPAPSNNSNNYNCTGLACPTQS